MRGARQQCRAFLYPAYSTVTDLARLRALSTSVPRVYAPKGMPAAIGVRIGAGGSNTALLKYEARNCMPRGE